MPVRAKWQDKYGICQCATPTPATGYTVTSKTFLATDIGLELAKLALPLTNNPMLDSGLNVIDTRKAIGEATRRVGTGYEFTVEGMEPVVTLEMEATANMLALFSWLLFQKGASEGVATTYMKTCIPYTDCECEIYASILRQMSAGTADSHVVHGAICKVMNLSANQGEALKLSAEMLGANFFNNFDFDLQASLLDFSAKAPLLFQDCTITLDGTTIHIPGFSLALSNNAVAKRYSSSRVYTYVLGDLTGEGTLTLPWGEATEGGNEQLNNFLAGTDVLLTVLWGNVVSPTDGSFKITANVRYSGAELTTEDEIATSCPFTVANDGTNSIKLEIVDSVNRGIS